MAVVAPMAEAAAAAEADADADADCLGHLHQLV
jgi:hypothetical protein